MATCTKCGTALIDAAKFCAACGTPVAPPLPTAVPAPSRPPPPPPPSRAVDPFGATAAVAPVRPSSYGPPPPPPQPGYAPPPQGAYAPPTPPPITSQPQAPSFGQAPSVGQVSPLAASFAGVPAPPPPAWNAPPQVPASPYGGAAQPFPPQQGYGTPPPQPGQPPQIPYAAQPLPQYPLPSVPAYGPTPQPVAPQPAAPPPAQAPWGQTSGAAFGIGARVLVQWADGNRYPATVMQAAQGQCLVAFPDGRQQWVEVQYLSSGI